jgi:hypothetical protein
VVENCYREGRFEMPGRTGMALAVVFFAVAMVVKPVPAIAVPVSAYVSERDPSVRADEMQQAINNVINSSEKTLDRASAQRVLDILRHLDPTEMALLINDANKREPNVDLQKVVLAYVYQELQQRPGR